MTVLERGWLSSNSVLFDEGDRVGMVDTGYLDHAPQTLALVAAVARGRPLARIVNTHLHSDHVGGNAALVRQYGCAVWLPAGQAGDVAAWDPGRLSFQATAQRCERFGVDRSLHAGEVIALGGMDWELVAAPGHDRHMLMLYCADEGVLLSADALWQDGFGALFPEGEGDDEVATQHACLERIARLSPRVVVPGHGAAFSDVDAALERAGQRLQALAADPRRNARHVLKVLVKFWLLQVRSARREEVHQQFAGAGYVRRIHERYFAGMGVAPMLDRTLAELAAAGAARIEDGRVWDADPS